jgi:hypothetical protein
MLFFNRYRFDKYWVLMTEQKTSIPFNLTCLSGIDLRSDAGSFSTMNGPLETISGRFSP